ncbi:hypothetical protein [Levilactobacillus spicheri]|uniref:Uncharacterized protein n=2 Tax=Levilactobacillus spicheri TaxID=216463 RepID=A0ABQ0WT30_9LACO|nr:hypothetical protein [Levilactobacillus spicheri]GEO65931.1 hypothetical protein LSP04_03500 [Levilactobacillus spicheri]
MGRDPGRLTRHPRGFLTAWALVFLAAMSLLLTLILVGQAARHRTTQEVVTVYRQSISQYRRQVARREASVADHARTQRLLE